MNFTLNNSIALKLIEQGTEDYAAARCCLLNGLFSGLPMAAQAVEKYLKAYIYILDPYYSKKRKHDLIALGKDLENLDPSFSFKKFHLLLALLTNYYKSRYPEDKTSSTACTSLITDLDQFMLLVAETMPVPKGVAYEGLFFWTSLPKHIGIWPNTKWLTQNNYALLLKRNK